MKFWRRLGSKQAQENRQYRQANEANGYAPAAARDICLAGRVAIEAITGGGSDPVVGVTFSATRRKGVGSPLSRPATIVFSSACQETLEESGTTVDFHVAAFSRLHFFIG